MEKNQTTYGGEKEAGMEGGCCCFTMAGREDITEKNELEQRLKRSEKEREMRTLIE